MKTKQYILLGVGALIALYTYVSVTNPGGVPNDIFDWVSVLIGAGIFFLGVYYVMYNKLPF